MILWTYSWHISQRVTQKGDYGFAMGGKIDMIFDSFALNDEEIETAKIQLRNAVDTIDNYDREIKALEEKKKPYEEIIKKFKQ